VLIAAPAGWGKTLLASSWLSTGEAQGAVAWVSLGPAEDDLRAFWATVAEALVPAVGDPAAASLRNAVAGDLELAPGQVAAAVNGTPVVLVLDNLHEITRPVVHESLLRLVHRPPPGLRIVAITRRNPPWPLHRLRLAGVLTEIRAARSRLPGGRGPRPARWARDRSGPGGPGQDARARRHPKRRLHPRPSPYVGRYIFLRIDEPQAGRELVRRLLPTLSNGSGRSWQAGLGQCGAHLPGLKALGVPQDALDSFPSAFNSAESRSRVQPVRPGP